MWLTVWTLRSLLPCTTMASHQVIAKRTHPVSRLYHCEMPTIPQTSFLARTFFAGSYSKPALKAYFLMYILCLFLSQNKCRTLRENRRTVWHLQKATYRTKEAGLECVWPIKMGPNSFWSRLYIFWSLLLFSFKGFVMKILLDLSTSW